MRPSLFILSLLFFLPGASGEEIPFVSRKPHWAVTQEKFELAMERLRVKEPKKKLPVILCHGLFVNSRLFDLNPQYSLAEYLAREGFDVWNLSLRGTGRTLPPLGQAPKRWSLDDMIEKDLPAVIDYVRKESGQPKVTWVGFEMGALLAYGYLEKKSQASVARVVSIAAPVTFDDPKQAPMKKLLQLEDNPLLKKVVLYLNGPFLGRLLIPMMPQLEGLFFDPENIHPEVRQQFLEVGLAELNPGVLDHVLKSLERGEFVSATGDFSYQKNLTRVRIPVLLLGGEKDPLAPPEALRQAYRLLRPRRRRLKTFKGKAEGEPGYGHYDLLLGKRSREEVFPEIRRWLERAER